MNNKIIINFYLFIHNIIIIYIIYIHTINNIMKTIVSIWNYKRQLNNQFIHFARITLESKWS